ncbi:PP2C family protein-serine/threonine phosphatase [Roseateles cellulosilyticus]|uniref:SpoIIE family protein phosphatase n=1 Tax=Pelomonas cellulosilytica TaxID=2906762 RepID=A0ABS8Y2Y1_9BURK|nr:SpoIIE family protein phosphatase [Pelomonas sp. P8]MCE4557429.1 SpoIIE family protein phosphatase [Pelomonas sp. P8]
MSDSGDTEHASNDRTTIMTTLARPRPVVADAREHYLVQLDGLTPGQRIPFGRQPLRLGRRAPAHVLLADPEVSGLHCEVVARGSAGDALVTDLNSTNGTFLDGRRVQGSMRLAQGMKLQLGRQVFVHEYRTPADVAQAEELAHDLEKACRYVQSLLPARLTDGDVLTDWCFQPSTQLGGDAFGHFALDDDRFACYLIDVSGHGAGAAMHSVSVMNVLRRRVLPGTDFGDPADVLRSLNALFPMDAHDGLVFSIWYGVFDRRDRRLRYASGGHHPAYLETPAGLVPLRTRNLVIGAWPDAGFSAADVAVPPGARLFVFSDGAFELHARDGTAWTLNDLLPWLARVPPGDDAPARWLQRVVLDQARPGPLDDDFSLLTVTLM